MNTCCDKRTSSFEQRDDGVLCTVICVCKKFIAAQLFDRIAAAQAWSREKLRFEEKLDNAA